MTRRLVWLVVGAVVAGIVWPVLASGPQLDRTALALALAAPAAGAAVAMSTGRPVLVMAALSGTGAYVSGLMSLHGIVVPVAALGGAAAGAFAGAMTAVVVVRLDAQGTLVATLVLALGAGALVQALPAITGAESGLGPLPPISIPLGGIRSAVATPVGDFHILLGAAVLSVAAAALLVARGPGPAWRAVGGDRSRASDSGVSPLPREIAALAFGGALAALSGALAAHVSRVASPADFAPDVAALPLLAALIAGRRPLGAALIAMATGVAAEVVLPAVGWSGPPDAMSLALAVLAAAALLLLLPVRGVAAESAAGPVIEADAAWPLDELGLQGARLHCDAVTVRGANGEILVNSPALNAERGTVHAVVGPNGSGKTTLLQAIAARWRRRDGTVTLSGVESPTLGLLPQEGGGFSWCTVDETLRLVARHDRSKELAEGLAAAWRTRLALDGAATTMCSELSSGQRRLLDLARVVLASPNVLLCDEPLAGLDDSHRAAAIGCIRAAASAGLTVLMAEHDRAAVTDIADSVFDLERIDRVAEAVARPEPAS